MLVLSRKAGESIRIADDVTVVVLSVDGQRVRLGVQAPRFVSVVRSEVDPGVVQANQTSAVNLRSGKDLLKQAKRAAQVKKDVEKT